MADKEQVTPVENENKASEEKKVTLILSREYQTNGEKIGPGKVEVSELVAEDLQRREAESLKHDEFRMTPHNFEIKQPLVVYDAAGK